MVGIIASNNFAKGNDMFVPFHIARELADMEDGVKGLSISLEDPYKAGQVKQQLVKDPSYSFASEENHYRGEWLPYTWMQSSAELFKIMEMQKFMMVFVLSFIVLIAAFSIAAVMFTVTIQKKREIGVMKALGATPKQIINVFAFQGVFVGVVGSL